MKRTISILIALMMVLSSVSFAAPVAVSTVTTVEEAEQQQVVSEEQPVLSVETADVIHDEYGYLLYNLDFETPYAFVGGQMASVQGFVNEAFAKSGNWTLGGPGSTKKEMENGNSFIRFNNSTSQYSQFHVENGPFTDANGYYTIVADVRYISDNSGAELKDFSIRSRINGGTHTRGNTVPGNDFATCVVQYKNVGSTTNPLDRTSFVFEYKTAPTVTGVDKMDIDNIKLYYKPTSVAVTVLGNETKEDCAVEIAISDDMNSVITKGRLLELANAKMSKKCVDLTLEDGSTFESIDVIKVDTVKAVFKTYETTHSQYGTLVYEIDFEANTAFSGGQKVSAQGFVNEAFAKSGNWTLGGPGSTKKEMENGNSFIRFNNSTGQYSQFHVENGPFTDANGYYTIVADVRYISGDSGAELKDFSIRSRINGETHTRGNTVPGNDFATCVVQYLNVGSTTNPLDRTSFVFEYKTAPTETGVDIMDIDNIKLYYKPVKTTVTVLGDGTVSDTNVEITPANDSYVVTKSDLAALINVPDNAVLVDLTLSDGTAFETVDLDEVKVIKAIYRTYEVYDDTYGHLIYNLDFETDADYTKTNKAYEHGFVNKAFCPTSSIWHISGPSGSTTKETENGNSFIRMKNKANSYSQFQVYSNGQFTDENGYYTIVADVRANFSGNSGAVLKSFWPQSAYDPSGTQGGRTSFTDFSSDFKTVAIQASPLRGDFKLKTMKYTYEYNGTPTLANEDKLDLDNIKLYFKPFSVDVTVLGGENADFEAQKVNIEIGSDLNSTITKANLMARVNNDTNMILSDLVLMDGSAFESIDAIKVSQVKAVWMTRAPKSYNDSSIRVSEPTGIRFRASVTMQQKSLAQEYGFIVTLKEYLGENDATLLTIDSNIKKVTGVSYGYDTSSKKNVDKIYEIDGNNIFFTAALYGMPATKEAYSEKIVVRPYLKDNDGKYYYAEPIVRSVIDVAVSIRDGGYTTVDLSGRRYVEGILTVCGENL